MKTILSLTYLALALLARADQIIIELSESKLKRTMAIEHNVGASAQYSSSISDQSLMTELKCVKLDPVVIEVKQVLTTGGEKLEISTNPGKGGQLAMLVIDFDKMKFFSEVQTLTAKVVNNDGSDKTAERPAPQLLEMAELDRIVDLFELQLLASAANQEVDSHQILRQMKRCAASDLITQNEAIKAQVDEMIRLFEDIVQHPDNPEARKRVTTLLKIEPDSLNGQSSAMNLGLAIQLYLSHQRANNRRLALEAFQN
ncbi:hypothetical protein Rhal01_03804 [Rubritalea halochordaticola]|uniref:Tetratricopeptide repeat protein n=1 Tax=Rubritalea halochordaticola TaxID=714537 RepID=A0ABP9V4W4_9BACT